MIISVISPRRGLGQTTTTINIAATISKLLKKPSIIIDTDSCFGDIDYYLSGTHVTKGLDDFCSLYRSKLLSNTNFSAFSRKVHDYVYIMSANRCYEICKEETLELCKAAKRHYKAVLVDATTATIKDYMEVSDWVVVVLNQSVNTMRRFMEISQQLDPVKDKLVFVVNYYDENNIKYRVPEIKKNLESAGFINKVFTLPFEPLLLNDANESLMLNFTMNNNIDKSEYSGRLAHVSKFILGINEWQNAVKRPAVINTFFCNRFTLENEKQL